MKKMKRLAAIALSTLLLLPAVLSLAACGEEGITLRVFSWEEYIDEGDEGSYIYDLLDEGEELSEDDEEDTRSMIKRFEEW